MGLTNKPEGATHIYQPSGRYYKVEESGIKAWIDEARVWTDSELLSGYLIITENLTPIPEEPYVPKVGEECEIINIGTSWERPKKLAVALYDAGYRLQEGEL